MRNTLKVILVVMIVILIPASLAEAQTRIDIVRYNDDLIETVDVGSNPPTRAIISSCGQVVRHSSAKTRPAVRISPGAIYSMSFFSGTSATP